MWAWLDRLFHRDHSAQTSSTAKPPAPLVDPPLARVVMKVVTPALEGLGPFDHFLELQGLEAPSESALTPEEVAGDEALAAETMLNFREHQPGPSSLPAVALQVLNAVADQEVSLSELSRLVSQDPAMSAGVLRVANSAAYAATQEIETLRDAVTRLGLSEVGRVAGTVAARSLFQPQVRSEFAAFGSKWNEIFAESVVAARGAAWLAMQVSGVNADHVFLAGLLHDLGRSVGLRSLVTLAQNRLQIDPCSSACTWTSVATCTSCGTCHASPRWSPCGTMISSCRTTGSTARCTWCACARRWCSFAGRAGGGHPFAPRSTRAARPWARAASACGASTPSSAPSCPRWPSLSATGPAVAPCRSEAREPRRHFCYGLVG